MGILHLRVWSVDYVVYKLMVNLPDFLSTLPPPSTDNLESIRIKVNMKKTMPRSTFGCKTKQQVTVSHKSLYMN